MQLCEMIIYILRDSNNLFTLKRGALGANILCRVQIIDSKLKVGKARYELWRLTQFRGNGIGGRRAGNGRRYTWPRLLVAVDAAG